MANERLSEAFAELVKGFSGKESIYKVLSLVNSAFPFNGDSSLANLAKLMEKYNRMRKNDAEKTREI